MLQTQIKRLQLRPWSELTDYHGMSLPVNRKDAYDRFNVNLAYYQANYLIYIAISLLYVCFHYPLFIIGLMLQVLLFTYLFYYRTHALVFAGTTVSRRDLAIGFSIIATLTSTLFGGKTFAYTFALSILLICIHSVLRARSLNARGTAFIDVCTATYTCSSCRLSS